MTQPSYPPRQPLPPGPGQPGWTGPPPRQHQPANWPQAPRPPWPQHLETQRDVQAAMAARRELGPEYDDAIAAGLTDRVEQLAAAHLAELRHSSEATTHEQRLEQSAQKQRFVLGIVSVSVGVPITAIAGATTEPGLLGIAVAWAGIVGVNLANAMARKYKNR